MEQLLADQASMILNAVHEKLSAQETRSNIRLEKMEERFAKRLDELTKTLDKFLKRLSDIEEEFTFMKADLIRPFCGRSSGACSTKAIDGRVVSTSKRSNMLTSS